MKNYFHILLLQNLLLNKELNGGKQLIMQGSIYLLSVDFTRIVI